MAEHTSTITDTHHALAQADHAAKVEAVNAMGEMLQQLYRDIKAKRAREQNAPVEELIGQNEYTTFKELEMAIGRFSTAGGVNPLKHTPAGGKLLDAREFLEAKGLITLLYHQDFADSEPGHAPDGEGMRHGQEQHIEDKTFKRHMPTVPQTITLHPILDSFDPKKKPFTLETVPPSVTAEQIALQEQALRQIPLTYILASENTKDGGNVQGTLRFAQQQHPERHVNEEQAALRHR